METPTAYSNIVTPRSRRLRTIGVVLLVGVALMVLYGYFGLMPSITPAGSELSPPSSTITGAASNGIASPPAHAATRAERIRKLRVTAALAYWGVTGLLLVGVLLVAWLDLREISRQYVAERRAMWLQAASRQDIPDDGP